MFREVDPKHLEDRESLFQLNLDRLEQLAFRALEKGLTANQFIVVLIDLDDPSWTEVVDDLMPNHDWQQHRDRGEKAIAVRGTVWADTMIDYLRQVVPDIEPTLTDVLPPGVVRAVVMGDGGVSVYHIEPTPQYRDN